MKKTLLIAIALFITAIGTAQTVNFDNITVSVPSNVQRLDSKMLTSQVPKVSSSGKSELELSSTPYLYATDNLLLGFSSSKTYSPRAERSPSQVKSETIEMFALSPKTHKLIEISEKTINGIGFCVYSYEHDGNYYLRFVSAYNKLETVAGVVQYQLSDETKAKAKFNELLNGIRFK